MPPGPLRSRNFRLLLACDVISASGTGFYLPASEGLLPHTVPADQRAPANALDRIGRNSGQIGRRFRVLPGPGRAPGRPRDGGHRIAAGASVEVFSVNWATTMQQ